LNRILEVSLPQEVAATTLRCHSTSPSMVHFLQTSTPPIKTLPFNSGRRSEQDKYSENEGAGQTLMRSGLRGFYGRHSTQYEQVSACGAQ
jgi:hypothetical protein